MESLLTIRQANIEDIPLLLAWRKAMMRDITNCDEAQIAASVAAFTPWLEGMMAQPGRVMTFIGAADGEPCACAMVWVHEWYPGLGDIATQRGYILNVYTEPAWRRRGFAGQLVRQCVDWLRQQDIRIVSLHASPHGQSVYANQGFHAPTMPEMTLRINVEDPSVELSEP